MELPAPLLRLAEDLNSNSPLRLDEERLATERYVICVGAGGGGHRTVVQRLRLAPGDEGAVLTEVRGLLRARGRFGATWEVGPSSTPSDIAERLLRLGLCPDEVEPVLAAMVLRGPPRGAAPSGISVRRVVDMEDYFTSGRILDRCFGVLPDDADAREAELARGFAQYQADGVEVRYLALLDGEPVATGICVTAEAGVVLCGGATLPEARGRGAYRALVQARVAEALRTGASLVVHAGAMSRPILRRMGFSEVAEIRVLRDSFA